MDNDNTISTLNGLIETCKDGQEGFKDAAEGVERSDLKSTLYQYAQQRAQFAGELQQAVRSLGGNPETSSSFAGALHRGWIDIKSAITRRDEEAVLNECERGEDSAVKMYQDALNQNLPANVREIITRQASDVKAAHDSVRSLRNQFRSANA